MTETSDVSLPRAEISPEVAGQRLSYLYPPRPQELVTDDEAALRETVKKAFVDADELIILAGGALGDRIMQRGFFQAAYTTYRKTHPEGRVTIFVSQEGDLEDPIFDNVRLNKDPNIRVVNAPFDPEANTAEFTVDPGTQKAFVLDLHGKVAGVVPTFSQEQVNNGAQEVAIVRHFFNVAVRNFFVYFQQNARYAEPVRQLLGMSPEESVTNDEAQPHMMLPENHLDTVVDLATKFGVDLDTDTLRIGCVLQSNLGFKCYPLELWAEILQMLAGQIRLQAAGKKIQFNIFLGPSKREDFAPPAVRETLNERFPHGEVANGVTINMIDGTTIEEVMQLEAVQGVMVGDDTGTYHLALATDRESPVEGVCLYPATPSEFTAPLWRTNERDHAKSPVGSFSDDEGHQALQSGDNSLIALIKPEEVADMVLQILLKSNQL